MFNIKFSIKSLVVGIAFAALSFGWWSDRQRLVERATVAEEENEALRLETKAALANAKVSERVAILLRDEVLDQYVELEQLKDQSKQQRD